MQDDKKHDKSAVQNDIFGINMSKFKALAVAAIVATTMSGCATTQNNRDPLEGMNRAVYKFNDVTDKAVLKPIAGAYKAVVPSPLRTGVGNFFNNITTVFSVMNNLLQFKFNNAVGELGRFTINSTFGLGGILDLASKDGIKQHREDFGQTLGYWGLGSGPYLVLPLLGPSSIRDASGLVVDNFVFNPIGYVDSPRVRNSLWGLQYVDTRSQYLPASDLLDEAALDPYAFMRDAYLSRRANMVQDKTGSAAQNLPDGFEPDDSLFAPAKPDVKK